MEQFVPVVDFLQATRLGVDRDHGIEVDRFDGANLDRGLRRGFVRAGARSLLLTLWPVPDAETTVFMQGFYRRLLAGAAPEDGLAAARVEALRRITAESGPVEAARRVGAFVLDVRR